MTRILICPLALLVAIGCAPRQAATAWGYSHWFQRLGAGSRGEFERAQLECLDRIGAAKDPSGVAPDSPEESAFLECMNAAGWCTQAFDCQKPGA